jgi:hypothetical protein
MLLNAANDEPYFSTSETLHKKFEAAVSKCFNVELMG